MKLIQIKKEIRKILTEDGYVDLEHEAKLFKLISKIRKETREECIEEVEKKLAETIVAQSTEAQLIRGDGTEDVYPTVEDMEKIINAFQKKLIKLKHE